MVGGKSLYLVGAMNKIDPTDSDMSRASSVLWWLVPPVLAIVAFFPVLGMWFVADDFGHLLFNNRLPFPQALTAFGNGALFYRPFSTILTWNLGTALFGREAFPYHLVSLLLHALSAFLLARVVFVLSRSQVAGVIAGALFGVFPLITEPVAWLASQWDLFGMACLLGAVLGFAAAWRNKLEGKAFVLPYVLGLVSAFLAVGMKESTLPLPLVLPFAALVLSEAKAERVRKSATFGERAASFVRSVGWAIPYAIPSMLFVALRLIGSGNIGGYPDAPKDIQHFFWDTLVRTFLTVLTPINRLLFSQTIAQAVGLTATVLFFGMLILWARQKWPMLLLSLVWWLTFIVPVLNLLTGTSNPSNISNRFFYLSLAGFCMAVATLVSVPLEWGRPRIRQAVLAGVGLTLLVAVPVTWKQLQPWMQASRQTKEIVSELTAMLPPRNDGFIEVNTHQLPREYYGAYVFWNGLDSALQVFHKQRTRVVEADKLDEQALAEPLEDVVARWNADFKFEPSSELFYVDALSGMGANGDPSGAPGAKLWDFRPCVEGGALPGGWGKSNVDAKCGQGYLDLTPANDDPSITLPGVNVDTGSSRWLRIGVAARYDGLTAPRVGEWFWTGSDGQISEANSTRYFLSKGGDWQVYWTFVKADRVGATPMQLRFDPVNDRVHTEVAWVEVVPVGK